MKLYSTILFAAILSLFITSCGTDSLEITQKDAAKKASSTKKGCVKISDRSLVYPTDHFLEGELLSTGFDIFGYNYQAHIFKGFYANLYLGEYGFPPYEGENEVYLENNPDILDDLFFMEYYWPFRNDMVNMSWNDLWLSNMDCNADGLLDDENNKIGSGAWELYQSNGVYKDENGNDCNWRLKYKIISIPENAILFDGLWFDENGNEIGQNFYDQWAIIQKSILDPCGQIEDSPYKSPFRAGFGNR